MALESEHSTCLQPMGQSVIRSSGISSRPSWWSAIKLGEALNELDDFCGLLSRGGTQQSSSHNEHETTALEDATSSVDENHVRFGIIPDGRFPNGYSLLLDSPALRQGTSSIRKLERPVRLHAPLRVQNLNTCKLCQLGLCLAM